MNRDDFVKLVGGESDKAEYLPVAFLLCNGYRPTQAAVNREFAQRSSQGSRVVVSPARIDLSRPFTGVPRVAGVAAGDP